MAAGAMRRSVRWVAAGAAPLGGHVVLGAGAAEDQREGAAVAGGHRDTSSRIAAADMSGGTALPTCWYWAVLLPCQG